MAEQRRASTGDALERLNILDTVITSDVLVPPQLARYPELEDIVSKTARSAILGKISVPAALQTMETGIGRVLKL
jgi:hypothetical protein